MKKYKQCPYKLEHRIQGSHFIRSKYWDTHAIFRVSLDSYQESYNSSWQGSLFYIIYFVQNLTTGNINVN